MKNDYHIGERKISIPPTLLFSVVAKIPDVRTAVTMDLKAADNLIFIIGTTYRELGASEYCCMKQIDDTSVPVVRNAKRAIKIYRIVHQAIRQGLVRACHDISDGGLAVAVTEMCFAGEFGAQIDLFSVPQSGCTTDIELLFSESASRFIVEVAPDCLSKFTALCSSISAECIGKVAKGDMITFMGLDATTVLSVSRIDAKSAWKSTLNF
jgi:phosphoribosylformylglycinamidine (FGAM) synthase-like enzyme